TPDDVIDLLVNFALGIEPSFDDLDAIEIRANGIFQRGDEECRGLAGRSVAQITAHGNALGVADGGGHAVARVDPLEIPAAEEPHGHARAGRGICLAALHCVEDRRAAVLGPPYRGITRGGNVPTASRT